MRPGCWFATRANSSRRDDPGRFLRLFSEKVETEGTGLVSRQRWCLALWTALILLLVVPWLNYQNHSHWARIGWIPFFSKDVKLRDIAANVLLYAPWGYFWVRQRRDPSRGVWPIILFAAVLSVATEASQSYSHGRFPSATDVTCNLFGAFVGAEYARRNHR